MSTSTLQQLVAGIVLLMVLGCGDAASRSGAARPGPEYTVESDMKSEAAPIESAAPVADDGEWKRKQLGPSVWIETQGDKRRIVVDAIVCLREGSYGLECLLCRKHTKEHESILTTEANGQMIHAGLLVAGGKPGAPVQYEPEFKSPSGSAVKIKLKYPVKNKSVVVPAQTWIRHAKTKQDLEHDWVFAGSRLFKNQEDETQPPIYAANSDGGYICISNVMSAMLDLPINSPKSLEDRVYEPHTERIPPLETKVEVILEPVGEGKK